MPRVAFTPNLARHVAVPECEAPGATVGQALEAVFARHPRARSYLLDDQGAVRKHVTVFVNGEQITDRIGLTDVVASTDEIYVMQALSGG